MSTEPQLPADDSPRFEPSPGGEAAVPPEARAYETGRADQPGRPPVAGPRAAEATDPTPAAQKTSAASLLSSSILMIVGGAIAAGGYALARVFAPPPPPGEVSNAPSPDAVKAEDFKKLADRVDAMNGDLATARKQIADRPDYNPELKMQRDRVSELDRTLAAIPAQFDSINQKLATVSKIEDNNSAGRVDALDKRLADLAQAVDAMSKSSAGSGSRGNSTAAGGDTRIDNLAMDGAIDLFKAKKWSEANAAFAKLQTVYPNDASVWYYSALTNGFASGQWLGETERLVNVGLDKEKAGQPSSAAIDSVFRSLTPASGKDWLAGYRQRIGAR